MQASSLGEFAAVVGIDWADRKHDICLLPAGSNRREWSVLPHRPEAIAQWAEALHQRFGGRPIAVCVELAKGPLVYALQRYAFLVLFPVNPTTLAKYRQTFHVWVALSISHCFWAKAYYEQQRSRRASHQAALRALAFK